MDTSEVRRAVATTRSIAASLGLRADDAIVVYNSTKLALRLLPCDVLARVAPVSQQGLQFELDLARRLAEADCPVVVPDARVEPRAHERDGFAVALWTFHEPTAAPLDPVDYAAALAQLHAGMRQVEFATPRFTDRVDSALAIMSDPELTSGLSDADRDLVTETLRRLPRGILQRGGDQLLHGEPHPGNVLRTEHGPLFVDLETCCRGPVEFDLAHAPEEVAEHYPGVDLELLRDCRLLMLAMIISWRWEPGDQFPDRHRLAREWLDQLRAALGR